MRYGDELGDHFTFFVSRGHGWQHNSAGLSQVITQATVTFYANKNQKITVDVVYYWKIKNENILQRSPDFVCSGLSSLTDCEVGEKSCSFRAHNFIPSEDDDLQFLPGVPQRSKLDFFK